MAKNVTAKAPAKINWYLDILDKRANGYHNIKTVMQTIDLHDTLTFSENDTDKINISLLSDNKYNISLGEGNLIYKAARELGVYGVDIVLEKNIPVEAGLGGGSSDAATTLVTLNDMFSLGFSKEELAAKAMNIGSDVPFFVYGGACIVEGIGEAVTPIAPVTNYDIVIRKPDAGLSTKKIYELIDNQKRIDKIPFDEFITHFNNNDDKLPGYIYNAMEAVSLQLCPEIEKEKAFLLQSGCIAAMMSGSGSAVFGLKRKQ